MLKARARAACAHRPVGPRHGWEHSRPASRRISQWQHLLGRLCTPRCNLYRSRSTCIKQNLVVNMYNIALPPGSLPAPSRPRNTPWAHACMDACIQILYESSVKRYIHTHTYMHTNMHACIHTYIHTYMYIDSRLI